MTRLAIELDRPGFAPGEQVTATVSAPEGGRSRAVTTALRFCERGGSFSAVGLTIPAGVLHEGDLPDGWSARVAIGLPADAPPALRTPHGELWWELEARSDSLGRDAIERCRVEVMAPPPAA